MKKRSYSMTAKERKQLREKQELKANKTIAPKDTEAQPSLGGEQALATVPHKKLSNKFIILLVTIITGVILIVSAVLLIVFHNPYKSVNNTVAVINLSNGMKLEFEIYEEDCPFAATNFIFLAKEGYFNNTIIFDTQKDWVRFGGYESRNYHHTENDNFLKAFKKIFIPKKDNDGNFVLDNNGNKIDDYRNKFNYRLYADTSNIRNRYQTERGILTFQYDDTSTEFQINNVVNAQTTLNNNTNYEVTSFGRYLNDATLNNINAIATAERNTETIGGRPWLSPKTEIRIENIKLYNLNQKKWKNFNFISYMQDIRAINYWIGVV